MLLKALGNRQGCTYFSIASGGDNSFSLLTTNASLVVAVDRNPGQFACVHLKKALFAHCSYKEVLQFLGVKRHGDRVDFYNKIKNHLPQKTRVFWDDHRKLIAKGIIHAGKLERYFHLYRSFILPLVTNKRKIHLFFQEKGEEERIEFFNKELYSWFGEKLFRFFFSKAVMSRLGRNLKKFKYVEEDVADSMIERIYYGLTIQPTHNNPYLEYITLGNYIKALPHYLEEQNFEKIKNNLDKLQIFEGTLEEAFRNTGSIKYDGFNLSDIFEYSSYDDYKKKIDLILMASNQKARLVYWNMFVTRNSKESYVDKLISLDDLAHNLFKQTRTFYYKALVIEETKE